MSEGTRPKSSQMEITPDAMGPGVKHPLGPTGPDESADFMKNTGAHEGTGHGGQPESGIHGSEDHGKPGTGGGEDTTELDEDEGAEAEAGGDD